MSDRSFHSSSTDEESSCSATELGSIVDDLEDEYDSSSSGEPEQKIEAKIVVELPPDGIQQVNRHPNPPSWQESHVSSVASFVRGVEGVDFSGSSQGTSSFVLVGVSPQEAGTSDVSVGWSLVSSDQKPRSSPSTCPSGNRGASTTTGTGTDYSYQPTPCDLSSLGSFPSNVDVISALSTGETVLRCKMCKFHNDAGITVCTNCGVALVTNPCFDQDEQMARDLHTEEVLQLEHERKEERLKSESPVKQGTFFTEEIQSCIHAFDGFQSLPWIDFRSQAITFIVNAMAMGAGTKVSIAYQFTDSDYAIVDTINRRGFQHDCNVGFGETVAVSDNSDGAWKHFVKTTAIGKEQSPISIAESGDGIETLAAKGWLVAVSEKDPKGGFEIRWVPSGNVLPIVAFDAHLRGEGQVLTLQACIQSVCSDFFGITLDLDSCRRKKSRAASKPPAKARLPAKPLGKGATLLTEQIQSCLHPFDGFRSLTWNDLRSQATTFIVKTRCMGARPNVSIAYIFTKSDDLLVDVIQRRGFQCNVNLGLGKSVGVSDNKNDAWNHFVNTSLSPITEISDNMETLAAQGWLVAVSELAQPKDRSKIMSPIRWVPSGNVLPIASFDARLRDEDQVLTLQAWIQSVCSDFFDVTESPSSFQLLEEDDDDSDSSKGTDDAECDGSPSELRRVRRVRRQRQRRHPSHRRRDAIHPRLH